jgi:hypothetical protein
MELAAVQILLCCDIVDLFSCPGVCCGRRRRNEKREADIADKPVRMYHM